jgi:hypothetical protein
MNLFPLILVLAVLLLFAFFMTIRNQAYALDIDVRCAIHENDSVDVRIFVLGLKTNSLYTAEVIPDKSPPISVSGESDSQGIFWVVAKVDNGDDDSLFKVTLREDESGRVIAYGDDREPCHQILTS